MMNFVVVWILEVDGLFVFSKSVVVNINMVWVEEAECYGGVVGEVVMGYCVMVGVVQEDALYFVYIEAVVV